jgi:hypothetical protein
VAGLFGWFGQPPRLMFNAKRTMRQYHFLLAKKYWLNLLLFHLALG